MAAPTPSPSFSATTSASYKQKPLRHHHRDGVCEVLLQCGAIAFLYCTTTTHARMMAAEWGALVALLCACGAFQLYHNRAKHSIFGQSPKHARSCLLRCASSGIISSQLLPIVSCLGRAMSFDAQEAANNTAASASLYWRLWYWLLVGLSVQLLLSTIRVRPWRCLWKRAPMTASSPLVCSFSSPPIVSLLLEAGVYAVLAAVLLHLCALQEMPLWSLFTSQTLLFLSFTATTHLLPSTFSFGETFVVSGAFGCFALDALFYTTPHLMRGHGLPLYVLVQREILHILIQTMILGTILIGFGSIPLCYRLRCIQNAATDMLFDKVSIALSAAFMGWTLFVVLALGCPFAKMHIGMNPIEWTIVKIIEDPNRFYLCLFWTACIVASVSLLATRSHASFQVPNIIVRKYYHLLAVVMFVPAFVLQRQFVRLSFGAGGVALILLELVRYWRVLPLWKKVNSFIESFLDQRDEGPLAVSHMYLLFGCAVPLWINSSSHITHQLAPYAGILTLGVGDAFASLFGVYLGTTRWWGSKKTHVGTIGMCVGMVLFAHLLNPLALCDVCAIVCVTLMEAFTAQNDNIVLPFYFEILLTACTLFKARYIVMPHVFSLWTFSHHAM